MPAASGSDLRIVLDNSVTTGWVHPDQATAYSTALLDGLPRYQPVAPALWPLEFGNTMLVLLRRKRLTGPQWRSALARARTWQIELDAEPPAITGISELARSHGLSAYDAAYLDCALRTDARLATQDKALKAAARACDCWFDAEHWQASDRAP
jgi:predicted nucleic acid-binding protein